MTDKDKDELIPPKEQNSAAVEQKKTEPAAKSDTCPAESSTDRSSSALPNLYNRFVQTFQSALNEITSEPTPKRPLSSFDLEGIANFIKTKNIRNIVFMVGAGISTSAGIPDFRSPQTGLYSNLKKYDLPDPQAVFEIGFFQRNPEPFYSLCRELFPESLKPTPCHYFMRLLDEKGYLRRVYTQNIDALEYIAGMSPVRVITAHGSHQTSTCLKCKKKYSLEWLADFLRQSEVLVPKCSCGGIIKPDIVFFGESLPAKFFTSAINDFPKADLLVVIGTSLVVQPFASMVHEVSEECPRLLINLEPVGKVNRRERAQGFQGLTYGEPDNTRDVFWEGTADDGAYALAELLGFKDELHQMVEAGWKKIDEKSKSSSNVASMPHEQPKDPKVSKDSDDNDKTKC